MEKKALIMHERIMDLFDFKGAYLYFLSIILFYSAIAIIQPEFEFPDEYHHVSSTVSQERHDKSQLMGGPYKNYWQLQRSVLSFFEIDTSYIDPKNNFKESIFDQEKSLYMHYENNQNIVVFLRISQLVISSILIILLGLVFLSADEYRKYIGFASVVISWPLIGHSLIGYNSQVFAEAVLPIFAFLLFKRRFFSALIVVIFLSFFENQYKVFLVFFILFSLMIIFLQREKSNGFSLELLFQKHKFFTFIVFSSLVIVLQIYVVDLLLEFRFFSADFHEAVKYLHRDPVSALGLIFLSSLGFNGSLTSVNYYIVYIIYLTTLLFAFTSLLKDKFFTGVTLAYLFAIMILVTVFFVFFTNLLSFRYHTYAIPFLVLVFTSYLKKLKLNPEMLIPIGLVITLLGFIKFSYESYFL